MTQGKTFANNEKEWAAAHAVDKDFSTVAATPTDNGAGWLKLELDEKHFIHKIILYLRFYTNWYNAGTDCMDDLNTFKRCAGLDSNVDVSVYQGEVKQKSCGTLRQTYGLEQSDQIYTLLCNTEGDTVKLSKDTGVIAVCEIVIISTGKCLLLTTHNYLGLIKAEKNIIKSAKTKSNIV